MIRASTLHTPIRSCGMEIPAIVGNVVAEHAVAVRPRESVQPLSVPVVGQGPGVNGGGLLMLEPGSLRPEFDRQLRGRVQAGMAQSSMDAALGRGVAGRALAYCMPVS
ncbi:MAG: hypothetical protein ABT17_10865 [Rhodanobacter sp. SCN 69-32]|nr:MAG: hypothetical protein ABT17_10865 [Rhodanobacter sp. SCN 69-32]